MVEATVVLLVVTMEPVFGSPDSTFRSGCEVDVATGSKSGSSPAIDRLKLYAGRQSVFDEHGEKSRGTWDGG